MEFQLSAKAEELRKRVAKFMEENVLPNEHKIGEEVEKSGDPHAEAPTMKEIRKKAKAAGLWNLFLPDKEFGAGLTNFEYAPLCE